MCLDRGDRVSEWLSQPERLAAAALRGGAEPDLLDEVALWQTCDFWKFALFALIAYIRAAALSRASAPVRQACQQLAQRLGYPAP